jgi:hypothetical protein
VRSRLFLPGQGVLTSDHGLLLFQLTWDKNGELVDATILKDAGAHPDAYGRCGARPRAPRSASRSLPERRSAPGDDAGRRPTRLAAQHPVAVRYR